MPTEPMDTIQLGKTNVRVTPLGIGTWQWGDTMMWGYGKGYAAADIQTAFDASIAAGITFFDTAEAYGMGRSERFLGQFIAGSAARPVVATKFMPLPWRVGKGQLLHALRKSLERLGMRQVDLYQLHWPFPPRPVEFWAGALADAVDAGLRRGRRLQLQRRADADAPMRRWRSGACPWLRIKWNTACSTATPNAPACSNCARSWA